MKKGRFYGFYTDPEEIRRIASRMGIPNSTPLPKVMIVTKGRIEKGTKYNAPEFFMSVDTGEPEIAIPAEVVQEITKKEYTLGPEAREDIRHELAHYMEHRETGTSPGRLSDPYELALQEIRIDQKAGIKVTAKELYYLMAGLLENYNLDCNEAVSIVKDASRDLEISRFVVSRAEHLFREAVERVEKGEAKWKWKK